MSDSSAPDDNQPGETETSETQRRAREPRRAVKSATTQRRCRLQRR
ncbi:MAG: hypothetical protein R3B89_24330 [Polyangiaceae bacterium]